MPPAPGLQSQHVHGTSQYIPSNNMHAHLSTADSSAAWSGSAANPSASPSPSNNTTPMPPVSTVQATYPSSSVQQSPGARGQRSGISPSTPSVARTSVTARARSPAPSRPVGPRPPAQSGRARTGSGIDDANLSVLITIMGEMKHHVKNLGETMNSLLASQKEAVAQMAQFRSQYSTETSCLKEVIEKTAATSDDRLSTVIQLLQNGKELDVDNDDMKFVCHLIALHLLL